MFANSAIVVFGALRVKMITKASHINLHKMPLLLLVHICDRMNLCNDLLNATFVCLICCFISTVNS